MITAYARFIEREFYKVYYGPRWHRVFIFGLWTLHAWWLGVLLGLLLASVVVRVFA